MRGERLIKANSVAKRRLKLVKSLGWVVNPETDDGIKHIANVDISWYRWELGRLSASYGTGIGKYRKYLCVHGKGRPKKGAPKLRGFRWGAPTANHLRRRREREFCRKARYDPYEDSL